MIGRSRLALYGAIPALFTLILLAPQPPSIAAQTAASSGLVSNQLPVNPDRIAPNYPIPYGPATIESIQEILNRIHAYLEGCTPARMTNLKTNEPVADLSRLTSEVVIERGSFPIISYEWGVTYSGMLLASEITGDARFAEYPRCLYSVLREPSIGVGSIKRRICQCFDRPGMRSRPGSMLKARWRERASVQEWDSIQPFIIIVRRAFLPLTGMVPFCTPGKVLRIILERLGMAKHLRVQTFSDEVELRKPHPEIFERTLLALGVEASEALHVGDTLASDIVGARGIGMRAVHLCHPRGANPHPGDGETIFSFPELLPSIEKQN